MIDPGFRGNAKKSSGGGKKFGAAAACNSMAPSEYDTILKSI
jgi:hypothetical protein